MNLASVIAVGKVWMKQEAPTYASVGVVHKSAVPNWWSGPVFIEAY